MAQFVHCRFQTADFQLDCSGAGLGEDDCIRLCFHPCFIFGESPRVPSRDNHLFQRSGNGNGSGLFEIAEQIGLLLDFDLVDQNITSNGREIFITFLSPETDRDCRVSGVRGGLEGAAQSCPLLRCFVSCFALDQLDSFHCLPVIRPVPLRCADDSSCCTLQFQRVAVKGVRLDRESIVFRIAADPDYGIVFPAVPVCGILCDLQFQAFVPGQIFCEDTAFFHAGPGIVAAFGIQRLVEIAVPDQILRGQHLCRGKQKNTENESVFHHQFLLFHLLKKLLLTFHSVLLLSS